MSATTQPATETGLTPDLIERVRNLSAADKLRVMDHLTPDAPDRLRLAWRDEIARRMEAVRRGEMKMYTLDEALAHLQAAVDEESAP
jgi:Putative addiction module component